MTDQVTTATAATAPAATTAAPVTTEAPTTQAGSGILTAPIAENTPAGNEPAPAAKPDPVALQLPGDDATPEQMAEFYKALGRPEKAEDYGIAAPDGVDGGFAKDAAAWMHEAGLNAKQANALAGKWNEYVAAQQAAAEQQFQVQAENDMATLQKEWGQNYDRNIELARRAARGFGVDQPSLDKIERAIGTKGLMSMFANIGQGLGEHSFEGNGNANPFGMTPEAARVRIQDLKADKAWRDKFLAGDAEAKSEWDRLHRIGYQR